MVYLLYFQFQDFIALEFFQKTQEIIKSKELFQNLQLDTYYKKLNIIKKKVKNLEKC